MRMDGKHYGGVGESWAFHPAFEAPANTEKQTHAICNDDDDRDDDDGLWWAFIAIALNIPKHSLGVFSMALLFDFFDGGIHQQSVNKGIASGVGISERKKKEISPCE